MRRQIGLMIYFIMFFIKAVEPIEQLFKQGEFLRLSPLMWSIDAGDVEGVRRCLAENPALRFSSYEVYSNNANPMQWREEGLSSMLPSGSTRLPIVYAVAKDYATSSDNVVKDIFSLFLDDKNVKTYLIRQLNGMRHGTSPQIYQYFFGKPQTWDPESVVFRILNYCDLHSSGEQTL